MEARKQMIGQKTINKLDMIDIQQKAKMAGKTAIHDFLNDWNEKTGGNEYGEPMYCGFAWVDVYVTRTNSKEAKLLESVGFKKSYRAKSMDCREVGAQAYADVLRAYGFRASMGSRAD